MARTAEIANRKRLKSFLDAQAKTVGLNWVQIAERTGYSVALLRAIRNNFDYPIQPPVAAELERVLRWKPGSIQDILNGGEPTLATFEDGLPSNVVDVLAKWAPPRLTPAAFAELSQDILELRQAFVAMGIEEGLRRATADQAKD